MENSWRILPMQGRHTAHQRRKFPHNSSLGTCSANADWRCTSLQGRLDVEAQCRGFLELSKEAVAHLVSSIFSDTAFIELFHRAFCSEEWQQGATTASILATVGDYLEEFEHLIEAFWFKRCAPDRHVSGCSLLPRQGSRCDLRQPRAYPSLPMQLWQEIDTGQQCRLAVSCWEAAIV